MIVLHRSLAIFLAVFLALHLGNHITLFWGVEYHLVVQDVLRKLYRHPLVEPVLLISFATQLGVGARLLVRRGWPRTFWPRMQVASGALIVLFTVQHIGAALYTRWVVFCTILHTRCRGSFCSFSCFPCNQAACKEVGLDHRGFWVRTRYRHRHGAEWCILFN